MLLGLFGYLASIYPFAENPYPTYECETRSLTHGASALTSATIRILAGPAVGTCGSGQRGATHKQHRRPAAPHPCPRSQV